MSVRELGNPFGNPFALRQSSTNGAPDFVIRRTSGSGVLTIPDGYRTRRVTLIAPGGAGGSGRSNKGGDSGQAGGSAQTSKAPVSDKQIPYSISYDAAGGVSTASLDGISLTATHGSLSGAALTGGATITPGKGVAFIGAAGTVGQTGVSVSVTADGAPSSLPGITGYSLGGSGAGGGGNSTFFGVGGLEAEGAPPATAGTSSTAGSPIDIIIGSQRQGSLGGIIIELWK